MLLNQKSSSYNQIDLEECTGIMNRIRIDREFSVLPWIKCLWSVVALSSLLSIKWLHLWLHLWLYFGL